jgi:hypothetical protein
LIIQLILKLRLRRRQQQFALGVEMSFRQRLTPKAKRVEQGAQVRKGRNCGIWNLWRGK